MIDGTGVYVDVDDIAISPTNGNMYTVGNDGVMDPVHHWTFPIDIAEESRLQDREITNRKGIRTH